MPIVVVRCLFVSVWDRLWVVIGYHWLTLEPPRTEPKGGVGRSGWENVMAVDRFCLNAIGPPEWEGEAMGSVVWV